MLLLKKTLLHVRRSFFGKKKVKYMKLIFISSSKYPNGGAAVNRHIAYTKGLKELGHEIIFILLKTQQWIEKERVENEIRFIQVMPTTPSNSKIVKIKNYYKAIRDVKETIVLENNKKKISAIILLDTDAFELLSFLKLSKRIDSKVFHERTEYPFVVAAKTIRGKLNLALYLRFVIKRFDGIYVINKALKRYFYEKTNGKMPVTIINMIVEPGRFENVQKLPVGDPIITYCGTLDGEKDGLSILIHSFGIIANEFPEVKLQLIGSLNTETTRQKVESLIKLYNLDGRVILTGSISRDEIPALLCNSQILVLSRPDNKQAEGGFPTKLGEYLATGNIVVVTNVGEITEFLTDNKNALIAEPNSALKFSEKLREALTSQRREEIGLEGKKLVYNEFNYLTQARILEKMFLGSEN